MAKEDHKPSKPELADHGIYPDRFVEVSRNYLCFSNSNGGRVTQRTSEYAKPEGRAARRLNAVAPENGHQSALRLAVLIQAEKQRAPNDKASGQKRPDFGPPPVGLLRGPAAFEQILVCCLSFFACVPSSPLLTGGF